MQIISSAQAPVERTPWGSLTWFANGKLGGAQGSTVGQCVIFPGCANTLHSHPNCEEVLHLIQGRILHSFNGEEAPMEPGDTIVIPAGVLHNAKNLGDEEAVMIISYSSPERRTEQA